MPKVDPRTKKGWVRVLPDLPGRLTLREVNPQPTTKIVRTPPAPKPAFLLKKRPSPDIPQHEEDFDSCVRERLPTHAAEAITKRSSPSAALNPAVLLKTRPPSSQTPQLHDEFDYNVKEGLRAPHAEEAITKRGSPSAALNPASPLKTRPPLSQTPQRYEEFNSFVKEGLRAPHAEEAITKRGSPSAALSSASPLKTRPPLSQTPQRDEEFESYVQEGLRAHAEGAITKRGRFSTALKSAFSLKRRPSLSQTKQPDKEFASNMLELLPSQGGGSINYAERSGWPPGRSDRMGAVADYSSRKPLIGRQDQAHFFGNSNVQALKSDNFHDEVVRKEKAFVMFYNPTSEDNIWSGRQFAEASNRSRLPKYTFASIDCSVNSDLCCREQATNKLPIFKLYSNGYYVSTSRHSSGLNADQMIMLVRMAPVLNRPRPTIDQQMRTP